jgi:hypothetical protein
MTAPKPITTARRSTSIKMTSAATTSSNITPRRPRGRGTGPLVTNMTKIRINPKESGRNVMMRLRKK